MGKRREAPADDGAEPPPSEALRPLDRRRIREIRAWLEGSRPDAPTRRELEEFVAWVSLGIESALARHQPVQDLLGLLNAARAQQRLAEG